MLHLMQMGDANPSQAFLAENVLCAHVVYQFINVIDGNVSVF